MKLLNYDNLTIQETIDRLREMTCTIQPYRYCDEGIINAIQYLEKLKKIESKVKFGKWVRDHQYRCSCSICGGAGVDNYKYCKDCGAEMEV